MRNRIAAEIINNFMRLYDSFEENSFYPEYRKRLLWVGEKINVIRGSEKLLPQCLGLMRTAACTSDMRTAEKNIFPQER